jgi:Domain of unknown function (DUF4173)
MSERTKQGLKVLEAALLLGVLGDGLLRATPKGLNVLLWTGAIVGAVLVLLGHKRRRALSGGGHFLLLSAILFAAAFAWRDSLTLNWLAGLGLVVALCLMAWRARAGRIWRAGITEYALGLLAAGVNAFFIGFPSLFGDVRWREVAPAGWSRHLRAVALGGFISLPLLLLFGGLLMSADAAFEQMASNLFLGNHEAVFGHIFLALLLAWITGGYLRGLLLGSEVKIVNGRAVLTQATQVENPVTETADASLAPEALKTEPIRLGIIEIGVTLGLLNLLFLVFVLLQLRYFFGDASLVQDSDGLTFSEYYRRGFFELVTVAGLVLPLLLGLHWLLRKDNPAHERVFRLLAGAQVFLLFVIMASAVRRMLLYQSEYGLTELRLYTTAFMAWLALVFIWFVATALRGQREQFACGALVAGLLVIMTLHVINPDALIVRTNVAHAQAGSIFDAHYASSLSADAAPALMESLPALKEHERRIIAAHILGVSSSQAGADWRSWNWARAERRRIVRENADALQLMAAPPPSVKETVAPPVVNQVAEPPLTKPQSVEVVNRNQLPASKPKPLAPARRKGTKEAGRATFKGKRPQSRRKVSFG